MRRLACDPRRLARGTWRVARGAWRVARGVHSGRQYACAGGGCTWDGQLGERGRVQRLHGDVGHLERHAEGAREDQGLASHVDAPQVVPRVWLCVTELLGLDHNVGEASTSLQPAHDVAEGAREGAGDQRDGVGGGDDTLHARDHRQPRPHGRFVPHSLRPTCPEHELLEDVHRRVRKRFLVGGDRACVDAAFARGE